MYMIYSNYLPTIQADYIDDIFLLRPNKSIEFQFDKPTSSFVPDGGISDIVDLSDYFDIIINLNFDYLNQTNKNFILDLYLDDYKADGLNKSFIFKYPGESEYYICKFTNNVSETLERNHRHSYGSMNFIAIGYDRNLLSTSSWIVGSDDSDEFLSLPISSSFGYDEILDYGSVLDYDAVLG